MYDFLIMFNSNIGPDSSPSRDIRLLSLGDLEFDLSRSLKDKCNGDIGLPTCGFLLMFNSNIGPNQAPLRDIRFQKFGDLDFDFQCHSRSNLTVPLDYPHMFPY